VLHLIRELKPALLDLDHDGKADFMFLTSQNCAKTNVCSAYLRVGFATNRKDGVEGVPGGVAALTAGAKIGAQGKFMSYGSMLHIENYRSRTCTGSWCNITDRYLGLKFISRGKTHYGWARFNVHNNGLAITYVLTGYAYETIPGRAIIAGKTKGPDDGEPIASLNEQIPKRIPEPATLGALALGAPGLAIWRREEAVAGTLEGN
jgi:hypothetical protein